MSLSSLTQVFKMVRSSLNKSTAFLLFVFIPSCIVFSGCATLGKDECLHADWRTIGYEDGAHGFQASRIGNHREACAKHGITPDFELYEQGRLQGLREYCTLQTGYSLGVAGKAYPNVCPSNIEPGFLEGYRQGKIVYGAQTEVNRLKSDLKKMHVDLDGINEKLGDFETELVRDESIGPKRRRYLLEEIKNLTDRQRTLEAAIAEQKTLLEIAELHLQEMKAH
jgi:hypothetical protein